MVAVDTDSFTRPDSTILLGSTDGGRPWSITGGFPGQVLIPTWGIIGGQAYTPVNRYYGVAYVDSGVTNGHVQVEMNAGNGNQGGVVFRMNPVTSEYWFAWTSGTTVVIYKVTTGNFQETMFSEAGVISAGTHLLRVDYVGANISFSVDGVVKASLVDHFNIGRSVVGLEVLQDTTRRFDNFEMSVSDATPGGLDLRELPI